MNKKRRKREKLVGNLRRDYRKNKQISKQRNKIKRQQQQEIKKRGERIERRYIEEM